MGSNNRKAIHNMSDNVSDFTKLLRDTFPGIEVSICYIEARW